MSYPPPPQGPNDPYGQPDPNASGQPGPPQGYPPRPPAQPPYGGGYPPQGPPGYGAPSPQSSGKATTSLVLGIASLVVCGLFTGIPAIVLGVKARREIRESNGQVGGDGLALGGIITGAIGTLIWLAVYAFFIAVVWLGAEWFDTVRDDICDDVTSSDIDDPNYEFCY
jgi:hypothetical protein